MTTQAEVIEAFTLWPCEGPTRASNMRIVTDVDGTADRFLLGGENGRACVLAKADPFDNVTIYVSRYRPRTGMRYSDIRRQIRRVRDGVIETATHTNHVIVTTDMEERPELNDELEPIREHLDERTQSRIERYNGN